VPPERLNSTDLILLGQFGEVSYFAYEIESVEPPQIPAGTRFEDLRQIASVLPADEAGILGYARAMMSWRRRHRFCGTCGAKTLPAKSGHVLVCSDPACRGEQFPRIDPAIIVLVSDGERALLGRQASWPPGRYSTIAGFVEPGESLEDAVAREVGEETGILVDSIEYHSSSWSANRPRSRARHDQRHRKSNRRKPKHHKRSRDGACGQGSPGAPWRGSWNLVRSVLIVSAYALRSAAMCFEDFFFRDSASSASAA